jgi:ABC-type uncharacterized transport system ATPase subunit
MSNIDLVLTPEELNALMQILDAAVKQQGLGAVVAVSHFLGRIEVAKEVAKNASPVSRETGKDEE